MRDTDAIRELQLEAMRDYVRARGWDAVEYVDTAAAGDLAHRTAWARLLADVAQRKVDLVMVWKLDRAFRSTLDALAALRDFEHAGVGFSALTQPELDTTSATGRLVFTILAGLLGSVVGSHNFAIIFVWVAWWTALKLFFIPFGGPPRPMGHSLTVVILC